MQIGKIKEIKGINKNMRPAGLVFFLVEIAKESKAISKKAKIIIPGGNNTDSISFLTKMVPDLFIISLQPEFTGLACKVRS